MKRKTLLAIVIPAVVILALVLYSVLSGKEKEVVLETQVEQGKFEIAVMVTGELQAIRETEIQAPAQLRSRNLRIRSVMIQDLIPEGTVVDSGQWVATLDRSEADNSLKDMLDELEQQESEYTRVRLDTTMQLRELRDELVNLNFAMEEAEITLEQSKFEPPATIRQAQIELERATRAYVQAASNYDLQVQQARANMREAEINMIRERRSVEEMQAVTWDLAVATLPDLSTMVSMTYVNEIDISKIETGQQVRVGVDAFPEKKFTGEVVEVANIGQQLSNTDAKVFEVRIELNERDTILRPSMTTSNMIVTNVLDSVLYIPLEAVHANDSLTYVYSRDGKKQVVVLGPSNENFIVVDMGLKKGDKLYLSMPAEPERFAYAGLELMEEIQRRKAEEEKQRQEMQDQMNQPRRPRNFQGGPQGERPQGGRSDHHAGHREGSPERDP